MILVLLQCLLLLILIAASAFFSGAETAMFSLSRARILSYRENPDSRAKRLILKLLDDYRTTLTSLILGNQFVNIAISILITRLLGYLPLNVVLLTLVSTVFSTVVLLLGGEITPKTAALVHAETVSSKVALPAFIFKKLISPAVWLIDQVSSFILNLLDKKKPLPLLADEYPAFLQIAEKAGAFAPDELELLCSALQLRQIRVAAIMTSRVSTKVLRTSQSARKVKERIRRYKREIYPVIESDLDDAELLFSAKEFYLMPPEKQADWLHSSCVSKAIFLPHQTSLSKALDTLYRKKQPAALVVDEYGRCTGLITLKDIVAELVSEVRSQYTQPEFEIIQTSPTSWKAGGMLPLHLLQEATGIDIPDDIEAITLNGLFSIYLDHLPEHGDTIKLCGLRLTAEKLFHRRLAEVKIELMEDEAGEEA